MRPACSHALALLALLAGACQGEGERSTGDTPSGASPVIRVAAEAAASGAVDDTKTAAPEGLEPPPPPPAAIGFLGRSEDAILLRLRTAEPVRIKKGTGGRSLGFKLTFADGGKAYFKPEQSFSGALWYAELVAHYLDRALGLYRVPPVVSRRLAWAPLRAEAGTDPRVAEVAVAADGTVRGALVHWLDEAPLVGAVTPPGWENWVRVESFPRWSISPYLRPAVYADALRARKALAASGADDKPVEPYYDTVPVPERPALPAELSDMLIFDFLTLNIDRWGGDNVNVLTLGAQGPLVYLDNAAGFSEGPDRRGLMDDRLAPCQRFRRSTVRALEALDVTALGAQMAQDPHGPLLSAAMLRGLDTRRRAALEHVATQRARFGEAIWLQ
jgi:hypothetical protein